MSGGGSKNTTTTVKPDPDIKRRFLDLYSQAQQLTGQPFQPYTGQRFADLTPNQNASIAQLESNAGLLSGGLGSAYSALQAGLNPSVRDVTAQPITSLDTASFLNPYTDSVVNAGLSDLDRARQIALMNGEDNAISAGAFGGSRQGVADSLTNEAFAKQAADLSANLRSQGFTQAQDIASQLAQTNANQALQVQQLNQAADLNRTQLSNNVAGSLVDLGLGGAGLLGQAGGVQQQQQQQALDFAYQQFLAQQQYPYQGIELLDSILSGVPQSNTSTTAQPGGSAAAGFLGGALGGATLGASVGGIPGAVAGGVGGGLLGLF